MSLKNRAAWLTAAGSPLEIKSSSIHQPGPDEILVKNKAWAINPIDWKMQQRGILVQSFPITIGSDLVGEVVAVGDSVAHFKVGDTVAGLPIAFATGRTDGNAFQAYTTIPARAAFIVPPGLSIEDSVKLPLGLSTAASGLYEKQNLGLPYPQAHPEASGKTIIIGGATSNVGSAAVQLATASGLEVVATVSAGNEAGIKALGASEVFDYRSTTLVDDLSTYLEGMILVGAFDAISSPDTINNIGRVLSHFGGGTLAVTQPPSPGAVPSNVKTKMVQALQIFTTSPEVGKAVFEDFVPQALKSGALRAHQKTQIAGNGLESIQTGLDMLSKQPSGIKVIVLA